MKIKGWQLYLIFLGPLVILSFFGFAVAEKSATNIYGGLFGATVAGNSIGLIIGGFVAFYEDMRKEKITLPKIKVRWVK